MHANLVTKKNVSVGELAAMAKRAHHNYVKAVVDEKRGVMVVDMRFHNDAQPLLESEGSDFLDIWGIRLHPAAFGTGEFVEFDSMLNIKPERANETTGVEDAGRRERIRQIVDGIVVA